VFLFELCWFPGDFRARSLLFVGALEGVCPKAQRERELQAETEAKERAAEVERAAGFTVADLVEMYLAEVIEDRFVVDSRSGDKRSVPGARKIKGQRETRRTLYNDAVRVLGEMPAGEVKRKDVVGMIKEILDRGARVQAGNVLRELAAAYEYAIGMERFPDEFANPAWLAMGTLKSARVRMSPNKGKRVLSDKELKAV